MLPAAHRLRRSVDFQRTVRAGARAGGATLVVHLQPDLDADSVPKVGFVVSKAVGNAVHRNAVKRRLRAAVRDELAALPPRSAVVIRALPAAAAASYAEMSADLHRCVDRALRRSNDRDTR